MFASGLVTLGAVFALQRVEQDSDDVIAERLDEVTSAAADAKSDTVHAWADALIDEVEFWRHEPSVIEAATELLRLDPDELATAPAQAALRARLGPFIELNRLRGYFITAADGTNVASSRNTNLGATFIVASEFPEVFDTVLAGETLFTPPQISDVPLSVDSATLPDTMFLAAPLVIDGSTVGVFSLRLNPTDNLTPLVTDGELADSIEFVFSADGQTISDADDGRRRTLAIDGTPIAELVAESRIGQRQSVTVDGLGEMQSVAWHYDVELGLGSFVGLGDDEVASDLAARRTSLRLTVTVVWLAAIAAIVVTATLLSRRAADRARSQADTRYRSLVEPSPDPILRTTRRGSLRAANPAALTLLGLTEDDHEQALDELAERHRLLEFISSRWGHLSGHGMPTVLNQIRVVDADGAAAYYRARITPIDGAGEDDEVLIVITDITTDVVREERLENLALTDSLTGLPNRAALRDRLEVALQHLRRPSNGAGVAILMLDVNHFKVVNDTLGHQAGDQLLIEIGRVIAGELRAYDTVGRLGGDEFLVISERVSDQAAADQLLERVQSSLTDLRVDVGPTEVAVACSVGLAWTVDWIDPDEFITQADRRMMREKTHHHTWTTVTDDDDPDTSELIEHESHLSRDLFGALDRNEFELHYQPIVDDDFRIVAAEALLRWRHPTRGLMGPQSFLLLLMEAGLMDSVGRWVVQQAITDAAAWEAAGTPIVVHFNLSPLELSSGAIDVVRSQMASSGVDPSLVCVELTEHAFRGALISNSSITRLGETGVGVALDDFGMGVSSISHLRHRPLRAIKLDRSLVAGIGDAVDESIMLGIMRIANSLGLELVAEGVETTEQLDWLQFAGCQRFQGWLFAPAWPAEDLVPGALLRPANVPDRNGPLR